MLFSLICVREEYSCLPLLIFPLEVLTISAETLGDVVTASPIVNTGRKILKKKPLTVIS